MAGLLARRGFKVTIYERRGDLRRTGAGGGRSINLALAERGLDALRKAGIENEVLANAVMMRGRCVHARDGTTRLLRYGRNDNEVIWSINRGRLNGLLLDFAERSGATIHFQQRVDNIDFTTKRMRIVDENDGTERTLASAIVIGCDGAGSALRVAMGREIDLGERFEPLGHGYKELEIPPTSEGGFRIERNALHIWPRGGYMAIALPNTEGSFTVTLFLPNAGVHPSFETVRDPEAARALFAEDFPDALPLMPELEVDFAANPVGMLGTTRIAQWHLRGEALILGDAAHPIVPFHGQGMNCAFEDCAELDRLLESESESESKPDSDWCAVFAEFQRRRKPNADAIADMAIENYLEMRDRVDDADFLRQRALEALLAERFPARFVPRYAMVTFRRIPYATAQARGEVQLAIMGELLAGHGHGEFDIAAIDWERARTQIERRLTPLD